VTSKNKYALIIPSFQNNVGYKLAALHTYLKHKPKNLDVFFIYGGNKNFEISNSSTNNGKPYILYKDIYLDVPDRISTVHKKLYKFISKYKNTLKKYEYVIKIDDDTFINNIDIIDFDKIKGDYIGNKIEITSDTEDIIRSKLRNLKYYKERKKYEGKLPQFFCSGECVMFSKNAIEIISKYKGSYKNEIFGIEDVFTGGILSTENMKIHNNKLIMYEHPVKENDFYKLYSSHYEKEEKMLEHK